MRITPCSVLRIRLSTKFEAWKHWIKGGKMWQCYANLSIGIGVKAVRCCGVVGQVNVHHPIKNDLQKTNAHP